MEKSVALKKVPEMNGGSFTGEKEIGPLLENGEINNELYEKFLASVLDQNRDYPPPEPILNFVSGLDTFHLFTRKSLGLIQGKQKSKKTVFLVLAVAAYIRYRLSLDSSYLQGIGEGIVLWFDTEQGESYAARTMQLILKCAGLNSSPRLIFSDLRAFSPAERLQIIKTAIENTPNVSLVIVDGLIDLISEWREPSESHAAIATLLRLCSEYNLHICVVLHQNKADRNAREIIGTITSQKCEMEISIEADGSDKARSVVNCHNSRGLPFEPFAIRWDKDSLPCIEQNYQQPIEKKKTAGSRLYETGKRVSDLVFKPFNSISYTDAVKQIMKAEPCGKTTAEGRIEFYEIQGFIEKDAEGKYRKKIS